MKLKCTTLLITTALFLVGCSESENKAPQQKSQTAVATKQQTLAAPEQETEPAPAAIQPKTSIDDTAPQNDSVAAEEKLMQEAKLLAEALTYEGDEKPREQVEKEIKEVLEAAMADLAKAKEDVNKQ